MRTAPAIITALLAVALAGCVIHGKPKPAPAPAPQPVTPPPPAPAPENLSLPQTQVQLPAEQPVDPDALETVPATGSAVGAPPSGKTSRRPRPQQGAAAAAAPPAHTETPPPVAAPPAAPPPETERGPVRELLDPAESKRLKAAADVQKKEVRSWLNSSRARRLGATDPTVARIKLLLQACDDAEAKDDMREASVMASRAVTLMRELQGGK